VLSRKDVLPGGQRVLDRSMPELTSQHRVGPKVVGSNRDRRSRLSSAAFAVQATAMLVVGLLEL
jgi:hypothetical protein